MCNHILRLTYRSQTEGKDTQDIKIESSVELEERLANARANEQVVRIEVFTRQVNSYRETIWVDKVGEST